MSLIGFGGSATLIVASFNPTEKSSSVTLEYNAKARYPGIQAVHTGVSSISGGFSTWIRTPIRSMLGYGRTRGGDLKMMSLIRHRSCR